MKREFQASIILIFVISISFSCNKKPKNDNNIIESSNFTILNINPKQFKEKDCYKFSKFCDSITYIPLETKDSFLIGSIDKIIVQNNKIFILDKITESIFCFDINGKFLYKIDRKGNGPEEYISIGDFQVNSKEEVIIYSSSQGFLFYKNGRVTKKIESSVIASDFYIDERNSIYLYTGRSANKEIFKDFPKQYRLIKIFDGAITKNYLPYNFDERYLRIPQARNTFFLLQDTLHLIEYLNQEIYSISNDSLKPKYKIRFTTNSNSFNFNNKKELNTSIIEKIKENDYTRLISYIETIDYLFISYNVENLMMYSYIRKKDLKINNAGLFYFDDFNGIPFGGKFLYSTGNELIGYIEPDLFLNLLKNRNDISSNLKSLKRNLNSADNPLIIKLKLK